MARADQVSRLFGFYCFTDRTSALRARQSWGQHFKAENMVELEIDGDLPTTRLDSNWIKNWRNHYHPDWASRYWAGEIYPHEDPVWECVLNVPAWIFGQELRMRAWGRVKELFPRTLGTLEISRLAAFVGSDLGSVHAFLAEHEQGLKVDFYMNMRDADDDQFLDRLGSLQAQGHPINPEARDQLLFGDLVTMDLKPQGFIISAASVAEAEPMFGAPNWYFQGQ